MGTIRKESHIAAPIERVWDALRDVANVYKRVVSGFVTDCRMEGKARIVAFFASDRSWPTAGSWC